MKIFLAGATGVIGTRLVPLLLERGHQVAGLTRTPDKQRLLHQLGALPVLCNVYDAEALTEKMTVFQPEMVIHQLTDLPDDIKLLKSGRAANARIRREGTRNLINAARQAGATRLLAQSIAWEPAGEGGIAKHQLEQVVLSFGGVVIRYGQFYGPGTYYPDTPPEPPHVHIDHAARRTLDTLELASQIVTITDEPPCE